MVVDEPDQRNCCSQTNGRRQVSLPSQVVAIWVLVGRMHDFPAARVYKVDGVVNGRRASAIA